MAKLIFGCGYLGMRVARLWLAAGESVYAVTRSPERAEQFAKAGLHPIVGDVAQPNSIGSFPNVESVLYAIGYDRTSGVPIERVYVDGLSAVIERLKAVQRFIYVSSTGVYGQSDGVWVDEGSLCNPTRRGGSACLAAERVLQDGNYGERAVILRMAGIYGPERVPRRMDLIAGREIAASRDGFLNLIHVDDAARSVLIADRDSPLPAIYCIADGQPALRREYYEQLARLLDAPPPRFVTPPPDSPAAQRAGSSKRVSNRRFLDTFQFELQYPSYCEGLAAILQAESR